jgi:hypothetical protein
MFAAAIIIRSICNGKYAFGKGVMDRIISLAVGSESLKKMVSIEFEGRFGDE